MLESFYSLPGRNFRATYATGQGPSRILAEVRPSAFVLHNHDDENIPRLAPLRIKTLDCLAGQNAKVHNTHLYEQTTERVYGTPHLVIRRGQRFNIAITFDRPYRPDRDNITFTFQFGCEVAGISSGSWITVRLSDGIKPNSWSAGLLENNTFEMSVVIQLLTPPNGIVGKATLMVDTERIKKPPQPAKELAEQTSDTSLPSHDESAEDSEDEEDEDDGCEGAMKGQKKQMILRYTHEQPVYVLFNPWVKEDQVYLADNDQRTQYVVKDFGHIYFGNQYIVSSRPWNYGQYEVGILDIANYLLDRARLRPSARGNAVNVVRAIAKLVNAPDDNGIVVGNWSGVYVDGTPPTQWTGSAPILNEFFETKSPVKYGQCWVFAGVATTVCRALGIPTRCVTNFASAHDCDGGNKVNIHWNLSGEPINDWNKDTIWCFHVWNEAFMARPDVDLGSGGDWQAFDVTPQLTADGVSCAGPCAVKSVKRGDVHQRYDCSLMFYELYTDVMHWNLQTDRSWRTIVEKNRTGRRIVTEKPPLALEPGDSVQKTTSSGSSFSTLSQGDSSSHAFMLSVVDVERECLDVTSAYKHPQGCEEERASLQRASAFFSIPPFYDQGDGDVKYEIIQTQAIPIGTEYSIVVRAQNTCRFERTVAMTLTLAVIYYTGLTKSRLRSETFNFNLCSLRSREVVMRVSVEDYSHGISELAMFRVYMHAVVEETEQLTTSFSDFRLVLPTLDVLTPKVARVGEPFECTVQLASPMLISLQHCTWMVEALGMLPGKRYTQPESEPYALSEVKVKMFPTRPGPTTIVASFYSTELTGLTGTAEVFVQSECEDSPTPSEIKLF